MRVLAFTYKAEISGGSNRSFLSILDLLKSQGHEVYLYLPKKSGQMYQEAHKIQVSAKYLPYSRCGHRFNGSVLKDIIWQLIIWLKVCWDFVLALLHRGEMLRLQPDIIYTNGMDVHIGRFVSLITGIPHVNHIRDQYEERICVPCFFRFTAMATRKIILISNDLCNTYHKGGIPMSKLAMIHNGIKYIEQPANVPHEGFELLQTARVCREKRVFDAVKAVSIIITKHPGAKIHLNIAGTAVTEQDKQYKAMIEAFIADNKMQNVVTFLGEVKDMSPLRSRMDVELMCSEREPFGRVTVEGMRSGLPVVGSNTGGTPDIITDGETGFLYEMGNVEDLADRIVRLMDDHQLWLRMSEEARRFASTHFTEDQLQKTIDLLMQVAHPKS